MSVDTSASNALATDAEREEETAQPPFAIVRAVVEAVELVSPSFVRITFGGPELRGVGNPGETLDQRIKLVFPPASGILPEIGRADDWYQEWLAVPEEERGSMRTYSIRDLVVAREATTLVIDFVLHLSPGASGPASEWASRAQVGDELLIVAPRRGRSDGGGIEYCPGAAETVLLAGDETAAPAIARILEDVDASASGVAFIEVPDERDRLDIAAPEGVEVRWLPRAGGDTGTALIPAVLEHLGARAQVRIRDVDSEEMLWETPQYSGLGEEIGAGIGEGVGEAENHADTYFWIAGESGTVTTLRRHLVKDLGVARAQVAFMGYWRKGVAMRG